mmetsp:Transcript_100083/g.322741  ORF Transcript_100083/g.322741 Transcript_100083/m.322741 type:complete len:411 (-) Transcript_100083:27-1259(-)
MPRRLRARRQPQRQRVRDLRRRAGPARGALGDRRAPLERGRAAGGERLPSAQECRGAHGDGHQTCGAARGAALRLARGARGGRGRRRLPRRGRRPLPRRGRRRGLRRAARVRALLPGRQGPELLAHAQLRRRPPPGDDERGPLHRRQARRGPPHHLALRRRGAGEHEPALRHAGRRGFRLEDRRHRGPLLRGPLQQRALRPLRCAGGGGAARPALPAGGGPRGRQLRAPPGRRGPLPRPRGAGRAGPGGGPQARAGGGALQRAVVPEMGVHGRPLAQRGPLLLRGRQRHGHARALPVLQPGGQDHDAAVRAPRERLGAAAPLLGRQRPHPLRCQVPGRPPSAAAGGRHDALRRGAVARRAVGAALGGDAAGDKALPGGGGGQARPGGRGRGLRPREGAGGPGSRGAEVHG